jgi:type I restriction enzyme, S subunit
MQGKTFRRQVLQNTRGTLAKHVYAKNLQRIKVPVLPLELQQMIQQEITAFLDLFVKLDQLQKLEAAARRQQMQHYIDRLLSF